MSDQDKLNVIELAQTKFVFVELYAKAGKRSFVR